MAEKLQPVRGTHDLMPAEMRRHRQIVDTALHTAQSFGYEEVATPIFEKTEVFARTLGDTSDIVTKEMYTFPDRGGESLTLRPEGTAGVARAVISEGMQQSLPLKFFYAGPMFRYERPQKGRLRQFHQTGVELLGIAEPEGDAEIIATGVAFLQALGLFARCRLEINSLGDRESRLLYREKLRAYLMDYRDRLSADSRLRLERNPLRIWDSKEEGDRAILVNAPLYSESLTPKAKDFFARVKAALAAQDIAWVENLALVRGLDYYCHTCFEITCAELGAQSTVLAGGRYDGLVAAMGGPEVAGVGWASGVERLALLMGETPPKVIFTLLPLGEAAAKESFHLAKRLRGEGLRIDLQIAGGMGKRMKRADKIGARAALILGDNELATGMVTLRDMQSGEQRPVAQAGLAAILKAL